MTLVLLFCAILRSSSSFLLLSVSLALPLLAPSWRIFFKQLPEVKKIFEQSLKKSRSMCSLAFRERNRTLLTHKDQTTTMQTYAFRRELASSKFILSEVSAFSKTVSWHPSAANKERQGIAGEWFLCNQHLRLWKDSPLPSVFISPQWFRSPVLRGPRFDCGHKAGGISVVMLGEVLFHCVLLIAC